MTRVRSFASPHKGLRNILSKFSFLAGRTNYSDQKEVEKLKQLWHETLSLLNDHVHTENEYTLKRLEEKTKGSSHHDLQDHEELEKIQEDISAHLDELDGSQDSGTGHDFYLAFTGFQSRYLEHILHEETVTEKLLWDNFTDEELTLHRIETMQRIEFPILLLWLKYIIPAQTEEESIGMLSGFKANAPAEAFHAVLTTIKPEMGEQDFSKLINKLK